GRTQGEPVLGRAGLGRGEEDGAIIVLGHPDAREGRQVVAGLGGIVAASPQGECREEGDGRGETSRAKHGGSLRLEGGVAPVSASSGTMSRGARFLTGRRHRSSGAAARGNTISVPSAVACGSRVPRARPALVTRTRPRLAGTVTW